MKDIIRNCVVPFAVIAGIITTSASLFAQTTGGRPDIVWMRSGHYGAAGGGMLALDFLDNDRLITLDNNFGGILKIHRLSDGVMLRSIPTALSPGYGMKVSPNGKWLALFNEVNGTSGAATMSLWDTATWTKKWAVPSTTGGLDPSFSADSSLVSGYRGIHNVSDGSLFWRPFPDDGNAYFTTMTPGGTTVAGVAGGRLNKKNIQGDLSEVFFGLPFAFSQKQPDDGISHPLGGMAFLTDPIVPGYFTHVLAPNHQWFIGNSRITSYFGFLWPNTTTFGDRYLFGLRAQDDATQTPEYHFLEAFDTINGERHTLITRPRTPNYGFGLPRFAVSPDGKKVALGYSQNDGRGLLPLVQAVTVPDGKPATDLFMHSSLVTGVAYSAQPLSFASKDGTTTINSHIVASVAWDNKMLLWDARNGERLGTVLLPIVHDVGLASNIALSPDSRTAAVQYNNHPGNTLGKGNILIYDISNPRNPILVQTLDGNKAAYRPVFSHDGQSLAFATFWPNNDSPGAALFKKQNGVWNSTEPIYVGDRRGAGISAISCAFAPDDKSLVVGSYGAIYRVSLLNRTVTLIQYGPDSDIALSEDGTRIAVGGYLLNANTGAVISNDPAGASYSTAIDPCSENYVYRTRQGINATEFTSLVFRNVTDGSLKRVYNDETGMDNPNLIYYGSNAASFSPDGQFLAFGRNDSAIVVMKNPYWTPPVPLSLTAPSPTTGGRTVNATITLDCPAEIGNTTVTLSSSDTTLAVLPAKVVIPVGKKRTTVPLTLAPVLRPKTVMLSARANGTTKTFNLTINPVNILTARATLARQGEEIVATVTVTNSGSGDAVNVRLTAASLANILPTNGLPVAMGDILAGQTQTTTLRFPGSAGVAGTASILRLSGRSDASTFNSSLRTVLP